MGVQVRPSLDDTHVNFLVQDLGQGSLLAAFQPCVQLIAVLLCETL